MNLILKKNIVKNNDSNKSYNIKDFNENKENENDSNKRYSFLTNINKKYKLNINTDIDNIDGKNGIIKNIKKIYDIQKQKSLNKSSNESSDNRSRTFYNQKIINVNNNKDISEEFGNNNVRLTSRFYENNVETNKRPNNANNNYENNNNENDYLNETLNNNYYNSRNAKIIKQIEKRGNTNSIKNNKNSNNSQESYDIYNKSYSNYIYNTENKKKVKDL